MSLETEGQVDSEGQHDEATLNDHVRRFPTSYYDVAGFHDEDFDDPCYDADEFGWEDEGVIPYANADSNVENCSAEHLHHDEDLGWSLMLNANLASAAEVHSFLDVGYSWKHEEPVQGAENVNRPTVRFHEEVEVNVFHGWAHEQFCLHLDHAHAILRQCWDFDGRSSSFTKSTHVLRQYYSSHSESHARSRSPGTLTQSDQSEESASDDLNLELVHSLFVDSLRSESRFINVETWYLCRGRQDQCPFSRTVTLRPSGTFEDFLTQCREIWNDWILPGNVRWSVVNDAPNTRRSTRAHVILAQELHQDQCGHLLHWDRWPILGKFRAQIIENEDTVRGMFQAAQLRLLRHEANAIMAVSCTVQNEVRYFAESDQLRLPESSVLYAYVEHVPTDTSDSETESQDDSGISTDVPDSNHDDAEEGDEVSWTATFGIHACFDQFGPYPWQPDPLQDEDIDLTDDEGQEDGIIFAAEDDLRMREYVRALRAGNAQQDETWTAITFGVALADLGRRDVDFQVSEIAELSTLIQGLWQDHAARGTATTLYFVSPQPEGLHHQRYLVFLVVVEYGSEADEDRWVLVREHSIDPTIRRATPFGASLYNGVAPKSIMSQLGHHECFPFGVRDCHVNLDGPWLENNRIYNILSGSLCEAYIGPYPEHVLHAEERVGEAEALFKVARSYFEGLPGSTPMILRVHGISPNNQPLGSRDVPIDYPDLRTLDWIREVLALWPFNDATATCTFVQKGSTFKDVLAEQPILHVIVNYATNIQGCPVLVHQVLHAVNEDKDHEELWATVLPRESIESAVRQHLSRHPFWFHPKLRTHLKRERQKIDEVGFDFRPGDVVDLRVNLLTLEYLLGALWEMHDPPVDMVTEEISFLQKSADVRREHDDEVLDFQTGFWDSHQPNAEVSVFQEICAACMTWTEKKEITPGPERQDDPPCEKGGAQPEGNSGLRIAQDRGGTCPIVISLEHTLEHEVVPIDINAPMYQCFQYQSWKGRFQEPWHDPLSWLPEGMHIHPQTWHALHMQDMAQHDKHGIVELFIDGATYGDQSGWAVVVVEQVHGCEVCRGMLGGLVITDQSDPQWIGACHHSNITAEVSALIVAQALALSYGDMCSVVIRPDLQLSQMIFNLKVSMKKNQTLASVSTSLARLDAGSTAVEEIRAHKGNPWNELADCVAKYVAKHQTSVGCTQWRCLHEFATCQQEREWAWLQEASATMRQSLPPLYDNTVFQIPGPTGQGDISLQTRHSDSYDTKFCLSAVSVNVLALDEKEGTTQGTRSVRLDKQMDDREISVVGLQEARTVKGSRVTDHYRIYSSGGAGHKDKQFLGCEIWLHRQRPIFCTDDGKKHTFNDFQIATIAADERRLILSLTGPMSILIASLHAPCLKATNSLEEITTWWEKTTDILERHRGSMMILCCDANAPLADEETEHYGLCGSEEMNSQGHIFQNFLCQNHLVAPSTFEVHQGEQGTWKHPRGTLLRRDYILLSKHMFDAVCQSKVITDCDLGFAHADHFPVQCDLRCMLSVQPKAKRVRWDKHKLRDPAACQNFQAEVAAIPVPRWDVDVDTHNEYFNQRILAAAKNHFQTDSKRSKVRPQLSEGTVNLITFKRQILQLLRYAEGAEKEEIKANLKEIEKQVKKQVLWDQRKWYDQWVEEIDLAGQKHDAGRIYRMLQRLGRRKKTQPDGPRPLPMLQTANGDFACSHDRMQEIWCAQFARNEAGISVRQQDLIDIHLDGPLIHPDDVDMNILPSVKQITDIIQGMKNGKVPGKNGILVEILKAGSEALAMQFLPLVAKAALWGREPLEWKSGCLIPLYKGKGPSHQAESFRSIMISDTTAKIHHTWIRRFLNQAWEEAPHSIQIGGKKKLGVDLAHHLAQATAAWTKQKGYSLALLFLDLRAAFYSVYREAMFPGAGDDRFLVLAMECFNITPDDWADIRSGLELDHALHGVPPHVESIVKDMFRGAHFTMDAVDRPVLSTKGTRPGDPVADVIFNMIFGLIMKDARGKFMEQTDFEWIGQPDPVTDFGNVGTPPDKGLLDIAYVDDAMFAVYGPDPQETIRATQLIASLVHDAARFRGLDVNYQKGKTELWLKIAGKGARGIRHRVWNELKAQIPVVTEHSSQQIHVVRTYKHLGSFLQENVTPVKEIAQRINAAKQAEGRLHRCFFSKKNVSLRTKKEVFRATVLTKHAYQAHVWCWVGEHHIARWEDGMRDVVSVLSRGALRGMPPFKLSTKALFAIVELTPPSDLLHVTRLKYTLRVLKLAPAVLWQMLFHTTGEHAWIPKLQQSFDWLREFGPHPCRNFPRDADGMFAVLTLDQDFTRKVNMARMSCVQYRKQNALAQIRHYSLARTLKGYGVEVQEASEQTGIWSCMLCGDEFQTRRGLAMHSVHAHGYRRKAKFWMTGTQCHACCKEYHTRARAITHLQSSDRCFQTYDRCFPPITDEEAGLLDAQDLEVARSLKKEGWRPTKALYPVFRFAGPRLPEVGSEGANAMKAKWQAREVTLGTGFMQIEGRQHAMNPDQPAHEEDQELDQIMAFVGNSPGGREEGAMRVFQMRGLVTLAAQVHIRSRIFLHFYSGYRRHQDLHEQLEALQVNGEKIHCVSIDICLARNNSNMMASETVAFWKQKMKEGWVAGVGGGPPCETLSAARLQVGGPPPLRSYDEPWGLRSLRKKQWCQVHTGTTLIFALIELLVDAAAMGLAGFLEHPAFACWKAKHRPASIWAWRAVVWLSRLACCQITTLDQCVYGCPGRKPTTILTIRMDRFRCLAMSRGCYGRCDHMQGHEKLIGRSHDGSFRTSKAKVYPPLLNSDLAVAAHEFLKEATPESYSQEPEFLAQMQCHEYTSEDIIQKDYHG